MGLPRIRVVLCPKGYPRHQGGNPPKHPGTSRESSRVRIGHSEGYEMWYTFSKWEEKQWSSPRDNDPAERDGMKLCELCRTPTCALGMV